MKTSDYMPFIWIDCFFGFEYCIRSDSASYKKIKAREYYQQNYNIQFTLFLLFSSLVLILHIFLTLMSTSSFESAAYPSTVPALSTANMNNSGNVSANLSVTRTVEIRQLAEVVIYQQLQTKAIGV